MRTFVNAGRSWVSTFLALFLVVAWCPTAADEGERWVFSSLWGQGIIVARSAEDSQYSVSVGDVTENAVACEATRYRVCFVSPSLPVAMPKEPPELDDAWKEGGAVFTVESIVSVEVGVFGVPVAPLYVVAVEHDLSQELGVNAVHRHRLYYSYDHGLLGFEELGDQGASILFLASRLPSLGGGVASD